MKTRKLELIPSYRITLLAASCLKKYSERFFFIYLFFICHNKNPFMTYITLANEILATPSTIVQALPRWRTEPVKSRRARKQTDCVVSFNCCSRASLTAAMGRCF